MKRKINITIEESLLEGCESSALKQNRTISNYIETTLTKRNMIKGVDDLINENQYYRGTWNFLSDMFELIKGKNFEFEDITINNEFEFLEDLKVTIEHKILIMKEDFDNEPKLQEYLNGKKNQ